MAKKKTAKKTYMGDEEFAELMESAEQALRYERGARKGYRVTRPRGDPQAPMSPEILTVSGKTPDVFPRD